MTRAGSWFAAHPWRWGASTATSILAIVAVILAVRAGLVRASGRDGYLVETFAVATGPVAHVWLTGPLADRVFNPDNPLIFGTPWPLLLIFFVAFTGV